MDNWLAFQVPEYIQAKGFKRFTKGNCDYYCTSSLSFFIRIEIKNCVSYFGHFLQNWAWKMDTKTAELF